MSLSKQQKLQMCIGCRDNFYNGNNDLGIKECYRLKTARVVKRKRVGLWQQPPWTQESQQVLSCRTESGYVFIEPHRTC